MQRLFLLTFGVGVEFSDLVQEIGLVGFEGADLRVRAVVIHDFLPGMGRDEHLGFFFFLGKGYLDVFMLFFCEERRRDGGVVLLGTAIGEQKRWRGGLWLGLRLRILFDDFHVINILFYCWWRIAVHPLLSPLLPYYCHLPISNNTPINLLAKL